MTSGVRWTLVVLGFELLVACGGHHGTSSGTAGTNAGGTNHRGGGGNAGGAAGGPTGGQGGSTSLGTLDLSALDPAVLSDQPADPAGLDAARQRAAGLVAQMTLDEKLSLVHGISGTYVGNTSGVARLGIPALTLQDGPAGVARFFDVTAFPAPITLAASWDRDLVRRWGAAMGAEERGKGVMIQLGPMMNMVRSPLAGRNFESFGEDPYLSGELAAADVQGIQSQRVVATIKHYVGNEQETSRTLEDSVIDERTRVEIYSAPFEASVAAGAGAVMCAYNKINGVYACESPETLGDLKQRMGFSGWVMSDWGATQSTAAAANAGLDMEMPSGNWFGAPLAGAVGGSVPMSRLDDMVTRILTSLIRVGVLDDPPAGTPSSVVDSADHAALAKEAAIAGITLLKNQGSVLPIGPSVTSIAVIGTAGASTVAGGGSAAVNPPYTVTPRDAISERAGSSVTVGYAQGDVGDPSAAVALAASSDVAVVCIGVASSEGADRTSFALPSQVDTLVTRVAAANPRTIVVLLVPSAVAMPWIDQVAAVLIGWYPGQEDGHALSAVLFGDENPGGKLPVSFPRSATDLPEPSSALEIPYTEGLGIGYRGLDAAGIAPLYPFGHGSSYTTFDYASLRLSAGASAGSIDVGFDLTNSGSRAGSEVAQLYLSFPASAGEPPRVLRGFERVRLDPGQTQRVVLTLSPLDLSCYNPTAHARVVPSGRYTIQIGSSSRDLRLQAALDVVGLGPAF